MKWKVLICIVLSIGLLSLTNLTSPYGIESPEPIGPYLNDKFPHVSPALGDWKVVDAFPGLTFVDPIAMLEIPDGKGFYIGGKSGMIWHIAEVAGTWEKTLALDINEKVIISGDAGLINIILHPEFGNPNSENGQYIYAYYAYHPEIESGEVERTNKFVRFSTFANSSIIDPSSEYVLIQDYDPQGYHMGGGMFFDEEGYFHLTFGDGGGSNNSFGSTQQITERFWGGMIRIDLDNDEERSHAIRRSIKDYPGKPDFLPAAITQGYMIPNDNPFIDDNGGILEEFYGLGFRSPHRATYDYVRDEIWVGDVGDGAKEEITVLKRGGNAQWPYMEGKRDGPKERPEEIIGVDNPPILEYNRADGNAVIGGFVYRGEKWVQSLDGLYLYGDHGSRNIWSFDPVSSKSELLLNMPDFGSGSKSGISNFSTDEKGNVYILKLYGSDQDGGIVYKLDQEIGIEEPIPALLSETDAFTDLNLLIPAKGIIPYTVNTPLWTDGAVKKRWIAVPNDGSHDSPEEIINFFQDDEWQFPSGTVLIKQFDLPIDKRQPDLTKKIETRFYIIDDSGTGYGLTYRWLEDESDAYLLDKGEERLVDIIDEMGFTTKQTWEYPSRVQCNTCHNSNAGYVLGVNTWQLNGDMQYPLSGETANQLATWNHLGMFGMQMDENKISDFPKASSLENTNATLEWKVQSYLAANCSYCHRPDGVEGAFDARYSVPTTSKNMFNILGVSHNNPEGGVIVKPGIHGESQLWIRDNSVEEDRMPPIGKTLVDSTWVSILAEWIDGLNDKCYGVQLTDIPYNGTPINGYGQVEIDMSNGEGGGNDGQPMSINGRSFEHGLGVHAESEVLYVLNKNYANFSTYIGVDDESCDVASVRFLIYADDELIFSSPVMHLGEDPRYVNVPIAGKSTLRLIATSQTDEGTCDHANWANPTLLFGSDSDGDGICDDMDQCEGADDTIDENKDGIPDGCDEIDQKQLIDYTVYPSPFSDIFKLKLKQPEYLITKARLVITDVNGRIYYEDDHVAYETEYRLGGELPAGVFYVSFKAGKYSNSFPIVKMQ